MPHNSIEESTRKQLIDFLPKVIAQAMLSYEEFLETTQPTDPKEFKVFQDACKVAINHIELLIKLAIWVDAPSKQDDGLKTHKMLENILKSAQGEINEKNKQ